MATLMSLNQMLSSSVVTRVLSTIKVPNDRIQTWLGINPDGPGARDVGGKVAEWDVFDHTRKLARGRPSGTGPGTRSPQIIGHVTMAMYRSHEQIPLLLDRIFRTRPLGGQYGEVDRAGTQYVTAQERYLAQLFRNTREFIASRVLRGGFQVKITGDDFDPVDSGGHFSVNLQVPAGNKNQLNMLGGGDIINTSWATVATADIMQDCMQINAAFEQLHGYPLRHVWCNSTMIANVFNNAKMQAMAGTANRVFRQFTPTGILGPDGTEDTGFTVVFEALPWLTWHVYDGGLEVDGSFTKFFPDTNAAFLPDPNPDWLEWLNGSEMVAENLMDGGSEKMGLAGWTTKQIDPAGFALKSLDSGMAALYKPNCVVWATPVF